MDNPYRDDVVLCVRGHRCATVLVSQRRGGRVMEVSMGWSIILVYLYLLGECLFGEDV